MKKPINIHNTESMLDLVPGQFSVFVLDGWGVELNEFSISLEHVKSKDQIKIKLANWPIQRIIKRRRAKKIFVFKIYETGIYKVVFNNSCRLEVKRSNLRLLFSRLFKYLPNENLEICFVKS